MIELNLANQITKPQICCKPIFVSKNKLTKKTFIKSSSILIYFLAQSHTLAQTSLLGSLDLYIDVNLQKTINLALKSVIKSQKYTLANFASCNYSLKTQNSNLYYRSLDIKCYYFCQQCKDHFNTANAISHQYIFFVALFF